MRCSVASLSSSSMDSVSSRVSNRAGRPLVASACSSVEAKSDWMSSRADMLTCSSKSAGSRGRWEAMSCAAVRSTHSPTLRIRSDSSATGMKTPGGTMPRVGLFQRTRASAPTMLPVARSTTGW